MSFSTEDDFSNAEDEFVPATPIKSLTTPQSQTQSPQRKLNQSRKKSSEPSNEDELDPVTPIKSFTSPQSQTQSPQQKFKRLKKGSSEPSHEYEQVYNHNVSLHSDKTGKYTNDNDEEKSDIVSQSKSPKNEFSEKELADIEKNNVFFMFFNNSTAFKLLVNLVNSVLDKIVFKVRKTSLGGAIFVACADKAYVSMIQARLEGNVMVMNKKEHEFAVNAEILKQCIKIVPNDACLEIYCPRNNDSRVFFKSYNNEKKKSQIVGSFPTLDDDNKKSDKLQTLKHDISVNISVEVLRDIVVLSQTSSIKVANIKFVISEKITGKIRTGKFTISLDADQNQTCFSQSFLTVTEWNEEGENQITIRTTDTVEELENVVNDNDLETVFEESFSAEYLKKFLSGINKDTIVNIGFRKQYPLVLTCFLTPNDEHAPKTNKCCFILSPCLKMTEN